MRPLGAVWTRVISFAWHHPFARRDRWGTLRRMVSWQVRSRLARGAVESPWVNGAKLVLRSGQSGATGNLYYGLHEFADMAFFAHFLREGDIFADIGANVGSYTILAGRVAGAGVHAFEPVPATIAALEANIEANGLASRVTIHPVALGKDKGVARFTADADATNRFARAGDAGRTIEVEVDTLDARLGGLGLIAFKIDVEGAEDAVFAAAGEVLAEPQLMAIEVETVGSSTRDTIERAGFAEHWYDPDRRALSRSPNGLGQKNHLFVRDPEFVAARVRAAPPIRFAGMTV